MKILRLYFRLLLHFGSYYWRAKTIYDIHSPFVTDLIKAVLEDDRFFYAFAGIESLREKLLQNKAILHIEDHGAGSKVNNSITRTVADIAKYAAISSNTGKQLFRLVNFCKPKTILELGTSLGISTLYLANAALNAKIITIEGCHDVVEQAKHHFDIMKASHIEIKEGVFEELLYPALTNLKTLDFLFLDGDHRAGASLQYFEQCLPYAHENSVFVIADIHWSDEMEQAWKQMQQHPRITLSVDLFHFGLLFFRKERQEKEHFVLIEKRYKPWRLGLFG
ncbi:MAG: class I SAM-dependent methyltransferase [Saprospiraceae bacterium]|nr:class I SAM-dependent methyltransferase [Saprospiraceae bacterium]